MTWHDLPTLPGRSGWMRGYFWIQDLVELNPLNPLNALKAQRKLVGGFKHYLFCIIYGIILPIDFHIFQDGWNHQPEKMFDAEILWFVHCAPLLRIAPRHLAIRQVKSSKMAFNSVLTELPLRQQKKGHMKMDKVWWTLRYVVIHYLYWVVNYYIYIYIIFVGFFLMSDIKVYVWGITNINQQLTADLGWFGGLGTRTPHAPRCREATTSARSWNHFLLLQESGRPVVWQAATKFLAVSRQQ